MASDWHPPPEYREDTDHAPNPGPQSAFVASPADLVVFGGSAGGGKAGRCPDRAAPSYDAGLETKVLTPKGFKLIGDIAVGDQVCNPDGTVARVIGVYDRGEHDFYRVTLSDGASVEASADHLWAVSVAGKRKRRKAGVPPVPAGLRPEDEWNLRTTQRCRVMTTRQLAEATATAPLGGATRVYAPQLPLTAPVAFTAAPGRWPAFAPYTLGALIGDGHFGEQVSFTVADAHISGRIARECEGRFKVRQTGRADRCPMFIISGQVGQKADSPQSFLRRDGLIGTRSHTKFIPDRIKLAPVPVRLAFIQGLFDTDGYIDDRGHIEYVTVSGRLATDVQWVLRSLGMKARIGRKKTAYTYKGEKKAGRLAYRVAVRGPNQDRLFSLPRKVERAKRFNGGDVWPAHRVVSVVPTGRDNARCIAVDHPNRLYVTDDFIVTHNTRGLLLDFIRQAEHPAARGVIFRRTSPQITNNGGLWDEAMAVFPKVYGKKLKINRGTLTLTFPSGAVLGFRHLQYEKNVYDWQGSQNTWVAFDEASHFTWKQVSYLLSRLRTTAGLPTKMRLTCNPDAESWLAKFLAWWIDPRTGYALPERAGVVRWLYVVNDEPKFYPSRAAAEKAHPDLAAEDRPLSVAFFPSGVDDTPQLAGTGYKGKLLAQSAVERERLLKGNWKITAADGLFKPHWFPVADAVPACGRKVRYWDLAATEQKDANDPDYTVGLLMGRGADDGRRYVIDVARDRLSPQKVRELIRRTAEWDGKGVTIYIEEVGAAGKMVTADVAKELAGWAVRGDRPVGDKVTRADPVAAQAEQGNVVLVRSPWNQNFLNELARFPFGSHDDQVDALSGAHAILAAKSGPAKWDHF